MIRRKVLIFSVPFGTGHNRAAEAIGKAFCQIDPAIESSMVDSFSYATPVLGRFIAGTYMEILKISPRLYGFLYDKADRNFSKVGFNRVLHLLMSDKLDELVRRESPEVVLCTHPFPLGVLSLLRKKGKLDAPLVAVVTDFAIHKFWLYDNVDLFIVGVEELKHSLMEQGVPENKIKVTGIPIDPAFQQLNDTRELHVKLGLNPDLPTVLVMGGGLGLGPLEQTVKTMLAVPKPLQIVVIAGKNAKLQQALSTLQVQQGQSVKVFGHVDNIHEFMEVADLVITKPGGLTSAEALAKGLPLVLLEPIPGHEERNLDFLTNTEVAVTSVDNGDIAGLVLEVLGEPDRIAKMGASAKKIGKPTSAREVARVVVDLMSGTVVRGAKG
ncbi:MAG TPA: glycosyltransferase [Verrucomicrobiae bacterium]|nr:glycosyltransferase [Verrucomicrobiae bacterium]